MTETSCVVTGAARGIGRAIAERLVADGHRVVITDLDPGVVAVAQEIGAAAGVVQDVRDPASHREVAALASGHGCLVAWFNNAGVGWDGSLGDLTEDQVEGLVAINLLGVIWGTRAALAAFGAEGGDVVITASLSGHGPVPGLSLYAATKAAVVSLAMSVNLETPSSVRIHALCPDGVSTELLSQMSPDGLGRRLVQSGGRMLSPEEVAVAAVDLLGRRRVVRTLPVWRGVVLRASSLAPSRLATGFSLSAAMGARAVRRSRDD